MTRPVAALVMAAGLGTRMNSSRAKVLHRLGGRPLIAYPLTALRAAGVDPIVVVIGHQAEAVRAACAPFGVRFAVQTEQRGTGDAARAARTVLSDFDGDLLLVYGDLPFLRPETFRRLIAAQQETQAVVSLLTETATDPRGFGRIVRDADGRVQAIVEERDATLEQRMIREINVGVYCADAKFLFAAVERLQPTNAQGELYLTDIVGIAQAEGRRIAAAEATAGEGAQVSSRADLAAREKDLREAINARWMAAGVTMEDPATAYIGPDVVIGRDTVIGPNVTLRGRTRIGADCRLDGSSCIADCSIADRVHIKFGVVMTETTVAHDVEVGPFAHLRPGTSLGSRVHVGDFVETKNVAVGSGTKAMHLAYLGDTAIGEETNIGAGTITCNYDGFRKHRTIIGSRVQIGSDSQLVAPVRIGDDAYIASGTTVMRDVPAGALVLNSKKQVHREGWVAVRRAREAAAAPAPEALPGHANARPAKAPALSKRRGVEKARARKRRSPSGGRKPRGRFPKR
ncbi:MAG: bifunctional UDP-N-acetylglucosamine diphosphorylase/glucosamine-1-phosphate N-acetyltransferase GlmU [Candidatus Binatia bacterium]